MAMSVSFLELLSYIFLFSSVDFPRAVAVYHLNQNCSSNETANDNSAFQSNLRGLLNSLSSWDTTSNLEFYNTTEGEGDGPDTAYGLYLCRGDVPLHLCNECVAVATDEISRVCPSSKEAIIWYDECYLRFSNRSFFFGIHTWPRLDLLNPNNIVSNQAKADFMRLLFTTINETADEAAKFPAGVKKFATKIVNVSVSELESKSLYCMAQCTPNLSPQDCRTCLSDAIGDLHSRCEGKRGGRVLYPSCSVRFELYQFYYDSSAAPVSSPPPANWQGKKRKGRTIVMVVVPAVGSVLLFCFSCYFLKIKKSKSSKAVLKENFGNESASIESLQFSLATIEAATNKFSHGNKIGKGGFGEVYKGILSDGREIAVKRLSRNSGQGASEFKNEVLLIAKLQHRNLVALLGFCLEEQEKILVYEYVPNKSLDYFLFGPEDRRILNWFERYKIIEGIARGILYLHEYSRLKVIHRDLKPSNILLDDNMNPKISDFGMAKMVAIDESQGSTNRIVGTYGYMSPEYAMFGKFSEKSDIFSFGVMVLEVISGRRNADFYESQNVVSLLSYVWKQWMGQKPMEILDSNLTEVHSQAEVTKCIQIGLLCVQENPDARPSIATVASYFSSDSIQLPFPQEPAFITHGRREPTIGAKESGSGQYASNPSVDDMSITKVSPR